MLVLHKKDKKLLLIDMGNSKWDYPVQIGIQIFREVRYDIWVGCDHALLNDKIISLSSI
jgi:hypothetical protein